MLRMRITTPSKKKNANLNQKNNVGLNVCTWKKNDSPSLYTQRPKHHVANRSQTTGENKFLRGQSKALSTFSACHTFKSNHLKFWVVPVSNVEPQSVQVRLWTSSSTILQQKYWIIPLKALCKLYSQTVRAPPNIQGAALKKKVFSHLCGTSSVSKLFFLSGTEAISVGDLTFAILELCLIDSETGRSQGTVTEQLHQRISWTVSIWRRS